MADPRLKQNEVACMLGVFLVGRTYFLPLTCQRNREKLHLFLHHCDESLCVACLQVILEGWVYDLQAFSAVHPGGPSQYPNHHD